MIDGTSADHLLKTSYVNFNCQTYDRSSAKVSLTLILHLPHQPQGPSPSSAPQPLTEQLPKSSLILYHIGYRVPSCTLVAKSIIEGLSNVLLQASLNICNLPSQSVVEALQKVPHVLISLCHVSPSVVLTLFGC